MMVLLKFVTFNFVKKRECCLYRDIVELMKFINKGTNSMEDGINKKLESEYNNSINNRRMQKSESRIVNEGVLWFDVFTGYS
jgi:hypothetical protein